MIYAFVAFLGFANGVIVGSGLVALLSLLNVIPRLAQITNTYDKISLYENIIIISSTIAAITSLLGIGINLGKIVVVIVGLFIGIFVGLLASALAEVLNVIPVIMRRFRLDGYMVPVVYSMLFGKVLGSFLNWLVKY